MARGNMHWLLLNSQPLAAPVAGLRRWAILRAQIRLCRVHSSSVPFAEVFMPTDIVLATLLLPIAEEFVHWPHDVDGGHAVLFLRARDGEALRAEPRPGLLCEQSFKPDAEALQRAGYALRDSAAVIDATANDAAANAAAVYPLVILLPPRQREEARALMARAVRATKRGGRVLACIANTEGARSGEADLARLVGPVSTLTKNKCRAFWSAPLGDRVDHALVEQWLSLDALRPVVDGQFVSRPGLFAWDRIDPATALLAAQLPTDLNGRVADLGAGHGLLTSLMLARCPKLKAVDLFEAEARALDVARINLAEAGERVALTFHWHDVTAGLPRIFDNIVSNPPFHNVSRAALPEVGQRFITVASGALRPGGSMWLVANRHLPYEAVLKERFGLVKTVAEGNGYKVIEAVKTVRKRV